MHVQLYSLAPESPAIRATAEDKTRLHPKPVVAPIERNMEGRMARTKILLVMSII